MWQTSGRLSQLQSAQCELCATLSVLENLAGGGRRYM
jgi:hypothetical protein